MSEHSFDPRLTEPQVSNRATIGFLLYFERFRGREFVERVVEKSGLSLEYAYDPEMWVSRAWVERFVYACAEELYGLEVPPGRHHPMWQHWREVGRMIDPKIFGSFYPVLRAFGSPGLFYASLPSLMQRANRLVSVSCEIPTPGRCTIRVTQVDVSDPDRVWGCWQRHGAFEGAPALWGLPRAQLEHTHCMHDADDPQDACIYEITYQERVLSRWAPILGLASGVGALAALGGQLLAGPATAVALGLAGAATIWSAVGWRRARLDLMAQAVDAQRLNQAVEAADNRYTDLWMERQRLARALLANQKFSGYLPDDLVGQIMQDPTQERELGGRRTDAAVLFVDIVGYTRRSELAAPERVLNDLNTWFAHADPLIQAHDGILDKRIGDALMVVFVPRGDESAQSVRGRAVACALNLLRAVWECNDDLAAAGSKPIEVRAGIAAGPLIQGNVGSSYQLEYTVIGDVVNLASRLEGRAGRGCLCVPVDCVSTLPEDAEEMGRTTIQVKGRDEAVHVLQLRPQ